MTVEELLALRKGSYVRLDLYDNSLVSARLMAGVRALSGEGTTALKALKALETNATDIESTPNSVWAMTALPGATNVPACVVLLSLDGEARTYFSSAYGTAFSEMEPEDLTLAINDITALLDTGNTLITWDGMRRDFPLLAEHDKVRVSEIAVRHYSVAFDLFCRKGFYIAFPALCEAMRVECHDSIVSWESDPDGAIDAAHAFLRSLLLLWDSVENNGNVIEWVSKSGKAMKINLGYWRTVGEAVELPLPDTAWMDRPASRSDYLKWIRVQ